MCRPGVKIVCFVLLLVAKDGLASVCNDITPFGYGIYVTEKLDFKTALECCEANGLVVVPPRDSNEKDLEILKRITEWTISENHHTFWLVFNDMAKEKKIETPYGNSLSIFEDAILTPGNTEKKDCVILNDLKKSRFEWVKCNTKHRLVCRNMEEYENATL